MRCLNTLFSFIIPAIALAVFASPANADDKLEYNRDIRPILADNCFVCHGHDSASRKADLRLDKRSVAVEMGAIAPGKVNESEMIRRILSSDADEHMPPAATKKKLTKTEIALLSRWIEEGAKYQLHWSFIPPKRPARPTVRNTAWVRNPIDNFIAAKLESSGLKPAPEAGRRTIARRVSLDLTGLPPNPQMVDAFLADQSKNAYEKLVDKLLESKHWGEHRGRYWLDYARYADTNGIHFDNYREMWSYRDWVIDAFNRNMKFDEFTIENLAGDLLPNRTLDQQVGSGFNRCNMTTNEGGIIDEEYLVLYTRDRTQTTAQVWLGLTAGCAVCHSHKFDPLSQKEFYSMSAFFNNTTQRAKDGNIKNTPPVVVMPLRKDRTRWNALKKTIPQTEQKIASRKNEAKGDFQKWLASSSPNSLNRLLPKKGLYLHASFDEGKGKSVKIKIGSRPRTVPLTTNATWEKGYSGHAIKTQGTACVIPNVGNFKRENSFTCTAWIKLPANDGYGAIFARMDNAKRFRGWDFWTQRRQVGMHIIDSWPENALKVVGRAQIPANKWVHVAVSYNGSGKASGVKVYYNGKPQKTNIENDKLKGSIDTKVPFKIGQRNSSEPFVGSMKDLRIYKRVLSSTEVVALAQLSRLQSFLAKDARKRTDTEQKTLFEFWLAAFDKKFQSLSRQVEKLESERSAIKTRGTFAHVMQEKKENAMAYVLVRGEYNKRAQKVSADTPAVLPPFPNNFPRNRLGFAKWLLLPEQPLTARVTVNRFWQEVFGTGIVKTAGNFGVTGELPSHQELLDWLAVEFRESGWDVKKLFKLIVMSATYRQSAVTTQKKLELDPDNRLLSRGPRFRMDAEMVRDYALAASGLLVRKLGGPSVKPYQPPGVWEAIAMNVSNTRSYKRGTGEDLYRRSLYTFIKRMAPPASMQIFNAPNRETCTVKRERTNTPLQALATLNDEQFIEAARHLALRAFKEGGESFESRCHVMGKYLLLRTFRPEELEVLKVSFNSLSDFYKKHPGDANKLIAVGESKPNRSIDPTTLAAWTMLANQLMNLDEVLNK